MAQPTPLRQQPNPQKPFDAGNPEDVRDRKELSKRSEELRIRGLRVILANSDAQAWLWDLMEFTGLFKTSFTGNSQTFYLEGQRNVGLKIMADISKHSPESLIAMMKERANG